MKKIKLLTLLPLLAAPLMMTACDNSNDGKLVIGICQIADHPALNAATEGFLDRKTRKNPKNGFSAAVLDQFLKGRITSKDITCIYKMFDIYTYAIKFKDKNILKYNEVFNEAQRLEVEYFGTKKVWSTAIDSISSMKAGSQQKDCMFLISEAITSCVDGKDHPIAYSSSPRFSHFLE